jgi:FkbH-like protein
MAAKKETDQLRLAIDGAIAEGDTAAARAALAQLWQLDGGPAVANFVLSRRARLGPHASRGCLTVAILRSYTVEPLVPVLRAAGFVNGLDLNVHVGDFNAYAQEILDPASALYGSWQPDAVILAVQTRDIAPDLHHGFHALDAASVTAAVTRVSDEFARLIEVFRRHSNAPLIVHGLELPLDRALGIADTSDELGQCAAVAAINQNIAASCRSHPGVHFLDTDRLISECGRRTWFDTRKWAAMRMPIRSEHHGRFVAEWLRYLHPIAGVVAKAIVVDLDNTLWGGVLGEDGADGLHLGPEGKGLPFHELQNALLDIRSRGVLLAVCSKNNHDDVMDVLSSHQSMVLRPDHFVSIRANWDDKATNIRSLADELGIGLDSIAFLDDNPAERDLIRRQLPEVLVLEVDAEPATYAAVLRSSPLFERLALSADDRRRSTQYAQRRAAQELQTQVGSLEDFLFSLQTRAEVTLAADSSLVRVAQLTQKTNQFNLTTRRYSEQDIVDFARGPASRIYTAHVTDRFGDHGLVGVAIVLLRNDVWEIDSFLLSCRVIGRSVETALLSAVATDAERSAATVLEGDLIETAKNAPARSFYDAHGFTRTNETHGASRWRLDLTTSGVPAPAWIALSRGATVPCGNAGEEN